ncbi:TetR/AcrR family transcriptional regulator [Streptomyces sp. MRC013]|uniref:TetR/AcrR family transcriptional regulator n=1 Tax=Streptomyces sp. MRC013 TaxID=2898276 RepID=UPI0020266C90|nr:TetR/AcrR family transcriptional regulator [Streptomyces sp. MRC013]URM90167.1 TetR/AcrR family transcriptional regulator [Streptomyces sp. MRC013]
MLDAAVRVFGRRGYREASMEEIAGLAGASKPLVYLYLNSKKDLFTACVRREAAALMAAVRAGAEEPGPDAPADRRLRSGLTAFFTHTVGNPDGWTVLRRQTRTHSEPFAAEAVALREEIADFVASLIAAAVHETCRDPALTDRDAAGLARALVGAAESLADWANTVPGMTAREATETLMRLAWTGLDALVRGGCPQAPGPAGAAGDPDGSAPPGTSRR